MHLRQHWKESANIILLRPTDDSYSVLTVRGSYSLNSLKVNSYVTPGGTLDFSDFSAKWWKVFEKFGANCDSLRKCFDVSIRPPIIADNIMYAELRRSSCEEDHFVTTDMALRIAAIRHLFVQTGILLVEELDKRCLSSDLCEEWRQSVGQSSVNFVKMCDELNLMPDLCSLKEWWNWLTPSSVGSGPRFDTIYYICCVNNVKVNECQHWSSPQMLIERKQRDRYLLAPPQVYELSRIMNFSHIEDVRLFAAERQKYGIERWIPLISLYSNGSVSVLPGDDLYPDEVELIATKPVRTYPQSIEEMRQKSVHLNRIELRGSDCNLLVNTVMPYNHIRPCSHYYSHMSQANL